MPRVLTVIACVRPSVIAGVPETRSAVVIRVLDHGFPHAGMLDESRNVSEYSRSLSSNLLTRRRAPRVISAREYRRATLALINYWSRSFAS